MSKKLSPQGYIYGKDPTATNPFWEETTDAPSADAADYVKSVAISSVTNNDGSTTYTVRTTSVSGDVDTTKDDTIDVPAAVVEYLKSLTLTQTERDNYVDYTITTTNQDGTTTDHLISVPSAVATELAQYTKTVSLSEPVTQDDGSTVYTFASTNVNDGTETPLSRTITIPAPGTSGPDEYVKSVTVSDATKTDTGTDYTITTVNQDNTTTTKTISVPDTPTVDVPTEYVKTLTKEKNTETGLTYLIVTDANSDTVNITIGTLDSVTTSNESTTTDGVNLVSVVETDADGNTDTHNLAYILTEPMAISSLTQTTDDDGVTSTSLNLSGTDQAGNAVTSSIAVQTKTETDGSTGVYLALTNLNETSQKILSISSGGGWVATTLTSAPDSDFAQIVSINLQNFQITSSAIITTLSIGGTVVENTETGMAFVYITEWSIKGSGADLPAVLTGTKSETGIVASGWVMLGYDLSYIRGEWTLS